MPIPVGSAAPDFTLKTKTPDGLQDVRLSDHFGQGPTVLLFFPLAFTGVCTTELCDVSSGLSAYEGVGARVIAISVDSPYAQEAFAQANRLKITLASDFAKTAIRAYDVVLQHPALGSEIAARSAFVIGKDGRVLYAEQTPTPKELPNFAAIQRVLAESTR